MKYILADDIYYSQLCISRLISEICPDLRLAGVAEDSAGIIRLLADHDIDFILAKDNISDVNVVTFMRHSRITTPLILISQTQAFIHRTTKVNLISTIMEPVTRQSL